MKGPSKKFKNFQLDPILLSVKQKTQNNRYGDISADISLIQKLHSPKPIIGKVFFSPRVSTRKNCKRLELFSPKNHDKQTLLNI